MSDSTDSEQEIVKTNLVRFHTNSSVEQKTKEKRKRDDSSSIDAETRAKQPQNAGFYAEKGNKFCQLCSIRMDHSRQSVMSAQSIGDISVLLQFLSISLRERIFNLTWQKLFGQSRYRKQLAPSPVETRWTSYFECVTYHVEFRNVEKTFLASEAIDIVDSDMLEDLREFLSSHFKLILLECKFFSERMKPLISVHKMFESNLGITSSMQCLNDCVKFLLDSPLRFYDDSVSEIINIMSETFTTGEKEHFKERVTASSQKANAKFGKYFDKECGLHPTRKFIDEAQFLDPKTALKFHVRPEFNAIPGFNEIPESEFSES